MQISDANIILGRPKGRIQQMQVQEEINQIKTATPIHHAVQIGDGQNLNEQKQDVNPEDDKKEAVKTLTLTERWKAMSKLKKGLIITAVVVAFLALVVGFTLLGVSLAWKPYVTVKQVSQISLPSKETLKILVLKIIDKNVIDKSVELQIEITSIITPQDNPHQNNPGHIEVRDENRGVIVRAYSRENIQVHIETDKAFKYYEKNQPAHAIRLLQQVRTYRRLQEVESQVSQDQQTGASSFPLSVQQMLTQASTESVGASSEDLSLQNIEILTAQIDPATGELVVQSEQTQTSRLLLELNSIRNLQQKDFHNFHKLLEPLRNILKAAIDENTKALREYQKYIIEAANISFTDEVIIVSPQEIVVEIQVKIRPNSESPNDNHRKLQTARNSSSNPDKTATDNIDKKTSNNTNKSAPNDQNKKKQKRIQNVSDCANRVKRQCRGIKKRQCTRSILSNPKCGHRARIPPKPFIKNYHKISYNENQTNTRRIPKVTPSPRPIPSQKPLPNQLKPADKINPIPIPKPNPAPNSDTNSKSQSKQIPPTLPNSVPNSNSQSTPIPNPPPNSNPSSNPQPANTLTPTLQPSPNPPSNSIPSSTPQSASISVQNPDSTRSYSANPQSP